MSVDTMLDEVVEERNYEKTRKVKAKIVSLVEHIINEQNVIKSAVIRLEDYRKQLGEVEEPEVCKKEDIL